ncbi:MAG: NAD(P)-binding protein [Bacteroidota bacterium]
MILQSCNWSDQLDYKFDIEVNSDMNVGHLLMKSQDFEKGTSTSVETLIVGGGVAGLSAAYQLKSKDFLLCELSDQLGGTSGSNVFNSLRFAQGAHYDLAYPEYYGEKVLEMLSSLNIIRHQPWKNNWSFNDERYIVPFRLRNQCFESGQYRKDVLREGAIKESFIKLIMPYQRHMTLPSTEINHQFRHLNKVTFESFLKSNIKVDQNFMRGIDYHMLDDYGGTANQVSALAGIHYFMCRPYYKEVVELFSPPQGNYYFIDKIASSLPQEQLLSNHLIKKIEQGSNGYEIEAVDVTAQKIKTIRAKKIIYAGQKHALKYIYPEASSLFSTNVYAPWMVINFILKNKLDKPGFWQNEIISDDISFLGFIDSKAQFEVNENYRVLTAYYCLPPDSRNYLANIDKNKELIVAKTIKTLDAYFNQKIESLIKKVNIKVMGHAMTIPTTDYLFNDKNDLWPDKTFRFAGVDNGRLPLLFDAMDSGVVAADEVR